MREPALSAIGIYVFSYRSDVLSGGYDLGDAVEGLKAHLQLDGLFNLKTMIFVCHSMGGILVRQFIVTRQAELIEHSIRLGLFLVASPSLGSKYANLFGLLARVLGNSQAQVLRFSRNNAWLNDLDRNFFNLKELKLLSIEGQELIEDQFIVAKRFIRRQVVPAITGARYFGEAQKIPFSDHFSIAKPEGPNALQHRLLVQFITKFLSPAGGVSVQRLRAEDTSYFIDSVYPLLESRIPEEELRSEEYLTRYLRDPIEAFPHYFISVTSGGQADGFLYASANRAFFNPFISYLVVRDGLDPSLYRRITRALMDEFRRQIEGEAVYLDRVCFLLEIADPADTKDPLKRRERLARFRLFAGLSESIGLDLRLVDISYFQPAISVDPLVGEVPLLLLVARQKSAVPWTNLSRTDVQKFIEYIYLELYLPRYSTDSATQDNFAIKCRSLFSRVTGDIPNPVPLLDYSCYLSRFRV